MKVNLKKICEQKELLKHISTEMSSDQPVPQKMLSQKIRKLLLLMDEIENDLEMCGESILELDMPRLDAIKERNRFLEFLHKADEP
jgi:hypothetical protein